MRIVHIHTSYANVGGAERYLFTTLPRLQELGAHNTVLYAHRIENQRAAPWPTIHVPALVADSHPETARRELTGMVADLQPDVILLHSLPDARIAEWLAETAPLAYFVHVQHPLACPGESKFLKGSRETCNRRVGPFCLIAPWWQGCGSQNPIRHLKSISNTWRSMAAANEHIRLLIVASRYMRDELLLNGYASERIVIVSPGTDLGPFPFSPIPVPDQRPIVLSAGRIVRHKGVDLLVRAMEHVRTPSHLVVVGTGPGLEEVHRAAQALPGKHAITTTGLLEADALDRWYEHASVVVVPSVWPEPFGLVGIEAMAHARPVIAFDRGGMGEWLHDGVNGRRVKAGDLVALGAAIDSLLTDPAEAARMGAAGQSLVRSKFTTRKHAERLLFVLRRAIGASAEPQSPAKQQAT